MASDKAIKNLEERPKRTFGGRQSGAGRPKGALGPKARTALEIKNRIAQAADNLLNAEMVEALGSFVVMKGDPDNPLSGFVRVTDEDEIIRFIQEHKGANGKMDEHVYILAAKEGNYKSRQYLFDRAFGRPAQSVEVTTDPEVAKLKTTIEARAKEKGTTYAIELQNYVDNYAPAPIKEKLTSDLIQ